jgi:hypothetical protein
VLSVKSSLPPETVLCGPRSHSPRLPSTRRRFACDHLHETTTRYDTAAKVLTFLLFCPICRIEEVVEALEYEPNFIPRPAIGAGIAS